MLYVPTSPAACPAPSACVQVRTTKQYARDATVIEPGWLPELAPAYFARQHANAGRPQEEQERANGLQVLSSRQQNGRS